MTKINHSKKQWGANRMVFERLIHNVSLHKSRRYLNISICSNESAGVAEWLLRSLDTRCPLGFAGSIPASGALQLNSHSKSIKWPR